MLTPDQPVVLLQHHGLDTLRGKTGLAMLRYWPGPFVAVIDPDQAGRSIEEVTGIPRPVPIVASMADALRHNPAVAVVGLAPSGGRMPPELREDLILGLAAGLSVASGLHSHLGKDPELVALLRPEQWIWDLRQEPADLSVASGTAGLLSCQRLLTVGTDMSVGKMSTCLELRDAARRRGLDARFVGTGQAGILISGEGVPLDAVRVDYAAGAVERAVLNAAADAGADTLILVEGQGSLCHAGSSATLPLIRGSQPTALLMVHRAGQATILNQPHIPLPPVHQVIEAVEAVAALGRPAESPHPAPRVIAMAVNTGGMDPGEAEAAITALAASTGLPCVDPVREGADTLLDVICPGTSDMREARPGMGGR
jgi:uncharacterized NAD-dependent epimerase/dehydratase family protein